MRRRQLLYDTYVGLLLVEENVDIYYSNRSACGVASNNPLSPITTIAKSRVQKIHCTNMRLYTSAQAVSYAAIVDAGVGAMTKYLGVADVNNGIRNGGGLRRIIVLTANTSFQWGGP